MLGLYVISDISLSLGGAGAMFRIPENRRVVGLAGMIAENDVFIPLSAVCRYSVYFPVGYVVCAGCLVAIRGPRAEPKTDLGGNFPSTIRLVPRGRWRWSAAE